MITDREQGLWTCFFHEQGNLEHVFIVSKVQGSENVRFNKQGSTCEHRL